MNVEEIDILAISAHPDDVEVGCGGFLAKAKKQGLKTGIIVLTKGGAGKGGNIEIRSRESKNASEILDVDYFKMYDFEDSRIECNNDNAEIIALDIAVLKPEIILTLYGDDYHSDHVEVNKLVKKAVFQSVLKRISNGEYSGPKQLLYFPLNFRKIINPDLVVDISEVFEIKKKALSAHQSQKNVLDDLDKIYNTYAALCDSEYVEVFKSEYSLKINNIKSLI
ncbi:MAG: bacillithiol biosynthesis deacetylase BshB1 [bacterium]|nr:bacillithiol biosynthesis deacetylase BshB1 [bacterium]